MAKFKEKVIEDGGGRMNSTGKRGLIHILYGRKIAAKIQQVEQGWSPYKVFLKNNATGKFEPVQFPKRFYVPKMVKWFNTLEIAKKYTIKRLNKIYMGTIA